MDIPGIVYNDFGRGVAEMDEVYGLIERLNPRRQGVNEVADMLMKAALRAEWNIEERGLQREYIAALLDELNFTPDNPHYPAFQWGLATATPLQRCRAAVKVLPIKPSMK